MRTFAIALALGAALVAAPLPGCASSAAPGAPAATRPDPAGETSGDRARVAFWSAKGDPVDSEAAAREAVPGARIPSQTGGRKLLAMRHLIGGESSGGSSGGRVDQLVSVYSGGLEITQRAGGGPVDPDRIVRAARAAKTAGTYTADMLPYIVVVDGVRGVAIEPGYRSGADVNKVPRPGLVEFTSKSGVTVSLLGDGIRVRELLAIARSLQ